MSKNVAANVSSKHIISLAQQLVSPLRLLAAIIVTVKLQSSLEHTVATCILLDFVKIKQMKWNAVVNFTERPAKSLTSTLHAQLLIAPSSCTAKPHEWSFKMKSGWPKELSINFWHSLLRSNEYIWTSQKLVLIISSNLMVKCSILLHDTNQTLSCMLFKVQIQWRNPVWMSHYSHYGVQH